MVDSQMNLEEIIKRVIKEITAKDVIENKENHNCKGKCKISGGCKCNKKELNEKYLFDNADEAVNAAKEAYEKLKKLSVRDREKIIEGIRKKCLDYSEKIAKMAVEETGMGKYDHKVLKHVLVAEKTPGTEDIVTTAWTGDEGLTLVEKGAFGVIAAITPSTNPTVTVFCNSIGMIAGGNTVVFAPHPGAKNCSNYAVKLINEASIEAGGPENIVVSFKEPSIENTNNLMKHKDVTLISATGGPGVVLQALSSGKRAIGAGAGNPPVLVDETADIKKAAKDILDGATFDNNLPCIAEKEVVAVSEICDELIENMTLFGAYLIKDKNIIKRLEDLVLINKNGKRTLNREFVGKDAKVILDKLSIDVDDSIRCIVFEGDYEDALIQEELMMPILGVVRVKDLDEGIDIAVKLEHGNRHSAHMHSKNVNNLTRFAKAVDTAIFVKNAPSYSAIGFGAEGFATFTIASKTGEGLSSASTFTKNRRCVLKDGLCIR